MEDLFWYSERLLAPNKKGELILPGPNALQVLNLAVRATDVPLKVREGWLTRLAREAPPLANRVESTLGRVRKSRARAQYDLFFSVAPLATFVKEGAAGDLTLPELRSKLIIALRLFTLARSGDLANIPAAIFCQQDMYFIRLLDKTGKERLLSISGRSLTLAALYLAQVSSTPCLFLLRHLGDPSQGLSAERIAKETLSCMRRCGVDTELFKAHALRGAAATAMLAAGVPQDVTRQRGGWSDTRAFERHYARLHQLVDWEDCLNRVGPSKAAGGTVVPQWLSGTGPLGEPQAPEQATSLSAEPLEATSPGPEPTQEGGGSGDEPERGEALRLLNARGLVQPLGGGRECPACSSPIRFEPAFVCAVCHGLVHVRCLQARPPTPDKPTAHLPSKHNPVAYSNQCIVCADSSHWRNIDQ